VSLTEKKQGEVTERYMRRGSSLLDKSMKAQTDEEKDYCSLQERFKGRKNNTNRKRERERETTNSDKRGRKGEQNQTEVLVSSEVEVSVKHDDLSCFSIFVCLLYLIS
jgi:hypothetical protein